MKVSINPLWRVALPAVATAAGVAAISLGGTLPSTAEASDVCPGGVVTRAALSEDAQIWDVEGKIGAYDGAARTITANGMTFRIPETLKVKTQSLDQTDGNIEFTGAGSLTDPALEAQMSVVGGTAIASGTTVSTPIGTAGDFCVTFDATSVYVEPAEHGVVGPLLSVDTANNTFVVGGTTVKMNADSRYPSTLADLAGTPLSVEQLQSQVGALLDAVGYYDAATGTLMGTIVEADILTPQAQTDTVALDRASWKSQELRVRGAVSRGPDGLFADSVDLFTGASDGTNCTGTRLATTAIDAADGDGVFEFRLRNVANPQTVCVKSLGGGVDDIAVTLG
jgi:hypothetical protein